ncbi:MAG: GerAB/ArcD/ProY family transporter [Oscillospiraceae bacterium]
MIKKISKWQLVFLLLLCRIFTLMTYVPVFSPSGGISLRLKAAVISILIQALLIIPLVLLERKNPQKTVTEIIFEKNMALGFIAAVLYLLFFISLCTGQVLHYVDFLSDSFLNGEKLFPLAALLLVCTYCAYCGTEGLARSSVVMIIPFIIMIAIMAVGASNSFSINNFYNEKGASGLFGAVMDDLARNGEIVAAAFLMKNVKDNFKCAVYWLLAAKLVITSVVFALITGVLGDYANGIDYPFLAVGSLTESGLFRQNGALYLIIWTISAVISISVFISIIAGISEEIMPELKLKNTISALAVFIVSAVFMYFKTDFSLVRNTVCGGCSQLILLAVIPLLTFISIKTQNKKGTVQNEV